MPWLFRLLTLIALFVAPLAAPADASAPAAPAAADCAEMDMGASFHRMPPNHHGAGESCCVAIPMGIDTPLMAVSLAPPADHRTFIAVAEAFRLGAGPKADDPPPRTS